MRLPRIRLTIRRMMLIVAIVAIVLEGGIVWVRHAYHRDRAALIAKTAAGFRRTMAKRPADRPIRGLVLDFEDGRPPVPATPEACDRFLDHLDRTVQKHEYAARHPWLAIEHDPPETK